MIRTFATLISVLPAFLRPAAARKRVLVVTTAFVVLAAMHLLLSPSWYASSMTLAPAATKKGGLSGVLGGELGSLASALDSSIDGGADVFRISAVLQSNVVSDAAIERFDLRGRYGQKYQEFAREALWQHCNVKTLLKPNLVQVVCEDKDPRFVQQLLAFLSEYGNQVFRRVNVTSASEEVRFLDAHAADLRKEADDARARMREFEEKYQIVDLDTQAKAVVSAMAALNSQRITKELELDYARTFASGDEASLQQLRSQLNVVDEKLRDLGHAPVAPGSPTEKRARRMEPGGGLFPAALTVPKLRAEYETLYRDRKVAETSLVFVMSRLEAAKAEEARNVSTFQVVDPPTVPTRKSRPRRAATLELALVLGLVSAASFEWWRHRRGAVHA